MGFVEEEIKKSMLLFEIQSKEAFEIVLSKGYVRSLQGQRSATPNWNATFRSR